MVPIADRFERMTEEHVQWLRDAWTSPRSLNALREALDSGLLLGPALAPLLNHLVACGWIRAEDVTLARACPGVKWGVARPPGAKSQ